MNNKNPPVSVVSPTYNREHLVVRAIRSVLDQTYHDFEIIVVFMPPKDPQALAEAIVRLYEQKAFRNKIADSSYDFVTQELIGHRLRLAQLSSTATFSKEHACHEIVGHN